VLLIIGVFDCVRSFFYGNWCYQFLFWGRMFLVSHFLLLDHLVCRFFEGGGGQVQYGDRWG